MSGISALGSGLAGIQTGLKRLREDAHDIATANIKERPHDAGGPTDTPPAGHDLTDLARPLVGLIEDRTQVAVSAQVIKTADEVLGTLIDIKA
ncbi:MAG: flagellar biosynthesis protein FlgE [Pseudomonadota bacterium]